MDERILRLLLNYLEQPRPPDNLVIVDIFGLGNLLDELGLDKQGDYWIVSKERAMQLVHEHFGLISNPAKLRDYPWKPELG